MDLYELLKSLVSLFSVSIKITIHCTESKNDLCIYIKREILKNANSLDYMLKSFVFEPPPLLRKDIISIRISNVFDDMVAIVWNKD